MSKNHELPIFTYSESSYLEIKHLRYIDIPTHSFGIIRTNVPSLKLLNDLEYFSEDKLVDLLQSYDPKVWK